MEGLPPPKPLKLEGNLLENWKRWKKEFNYYLAAIEVDAKNDKMKSSLLLHCIGPKAREIYDTLTFDEADDNMKLDKIMEKFEAYVAPRKNITYSRYKFLTFRQEEGQKFNAYLSEMKRLSHDCELGDKEASILRDVLVNGLAIRKLQERLLRETELTLDKVIKSCQNAELTHEQAKIMQKSSTANYRDSNVDQIRSFNSSRGKSNTTTSFKQQDYINKCKFCSYGHKKGNCPAFNKICKNCERKGHFIMCCPGKKDKINSSNKKKLDQLLLVQNCHILLRESPNPVCPYRDDQFTLPY